jgi:hypothetical protein
MIQKENKNTKAKAKETGKKYKSLTALVMKQPY